jgi:hypothetical protein
MLSIAPGWLGSERPVVAAAAGCVDETVDREISALPRMGRLLIRQE